MYICSTTCTCTRSLTQSMRARSHVEGLGTEVDAFGKVHEELMAEGLDPVRIPALQTEIINQPNAMAAGIHMAGP